MSARKKLNGVYITACFIFAGLIGAATESFVVFVIVLGVLLVVQLHDGSIRLTAVQRRRPRNRRRWRRRR